MIENFNWKNQHAVKWAGMKQRFGTTDLLPLWIADMDFAPPQAVRDVLQAYVAEGVYTYFTPPKDYYPTLVEWTRKRHEWETKAAWYRHSPGVIAGVSFAIQALTSPGDAILVHEPVYNNLRDAVEATHRTLVTQDLFLDEEGIYRIDFEALEQAFQTQAIKVLLFCSPQNPTGRVWTQAELEQVIALCQKYHVYLFSDEIHRDLIMPGHTFTSVGAVKPSFDQYIVFTAASKSFSLAAFAHSLMVIPNKAIRAKVDTFIDSIHLQVGTPMGYLATMVAYQEGEEWLDDTIAVIWKNYCYLKENLQAAYPEITISDLQGTYLTWIDLNAYVPTSEIKTVVQDQSKLAVNYGETYWPNHPDNAFIRINLATAPQNITQTVEQLNAALKPYS